MEILQTEVQLTLNRLIIVAVIVALLSCFVGSLIGWGVYPVDYADTDPWDMRERHQEAYVVMLADSYQTHRDLEQVQERLGAWDIGQVQEVAKRVMASPKYKAQEKRNVQNLMTALPGAEWLAEEIPSVTATEPGEETDEGSSLLGRAIRLLLIVVVLVGAVYMVIRLLRARRGPAEKAKPKAEAEEPVIEMEAPVAEDGTPPSGQFVTTYERERDKENYDTSFTIESPRGAFLGECGVSISERIGVGDEVTAFEIWLFDKNDIKTITKVLVSEYAFNDDELMTKLEKKGDIVLAMPKAQIVLETTTLRVAANIAEMEYIPGALPEKSQFSKLTIGLATYTIGEIDDREPEMQFG